MRSRYRHAYGAKYRPKPATESEMLIVRMARKNRHWGYTRISGLIYNLWHTTRWRLGLSGDGLLLFYRLPLAGFAADRPIRYATEKRE